MLHDPVDYPDPDIFDPERFIKDGKINSDIRNPQSLAFGFGRRYVPSQTTNDTIIRNQLNSYRFCPGRWLASASSFITIASVLHTMNIHPILGPDREKVDIQKYEYGLNLYVPNTMKGSAYKSLILFDND